MVHCPECGTMAYQMSGYYKCSACQHRFHRCPRCGTLGVFVNCPVCNPLPWGDHAIQARAGDLASFLAVFERPGYVFGHHNDDSSLVSLSDEVQKFISLSSDLDLLLSRRAEDDPRVDRELRKFRSLAFPTNQDREDLISTATDLEGICHLLYVEWLTIDKWLEPKELLSWFESDEFLSLLRHIKVVHDAKTAQAPPGHSKSNTSLTGGTAARPQT